MELLNKNGLELMNARRRYLRHYAKDIDQMVKEYIYTLYKEGRIPEKLFRILLDEKIDDSEVYAYLVSRREYTRSSVELNSEFDKMRVKVNEKLIDIGFTRNVRTENSISTNRIYIIKQYDVPKDFLLSYFGLTPIEIAPLMRRKGFMDKFCVLRLLQVFKEIYTELEIPEHIDHQFSKVYYNNALQGFSLDYKYMVNLNYLKDPARLADVVIKIKNTDLIVEKGFKQKMSSLSLSALMETMASTELQAEVEKVEIKERTGRRHMDLRIPYIDEEDPNTTEDFYEDDDIKKAQASKDVRPPIIADGEDAPSQSLPTSEDGGKGTVSDDSPIRLPDNTKSEPATDAPAEGARPINAAHGTEANPSNEAKEAPVAEEHEVISEEDDDDNEGYDFNEEQIDDSLFEAEPSEEPVAKQDPVQEPQPKAVSSHQENQNKMPDSSSNANTGTSLPNIAHNQPQQQNGRFGKNKNKKPFRHNQHRPNDGTNGWQAQNNQNGNKPILNGGNQHGNSQQEAPGHNQSGKPANLPASDAKATPLQTGASGKSANSAGGSFADLFKGSK